VTVSGGFRTPVFLYVADRSTKGKGRRSAARRRA
jgi:hypothetical protein